MKLFTLLLFLGIGLSVAAQNTYTLRIIDTQNKPKPNVVVTAVNAAKNITLTATTNAEGKAVFNLVETGTYSFSYLEMKDVASTEIKEGYTGTFSRTVTYDPKGVFAVKPKGDRTGIAFKVSEPSALRTNKAAGEVTLHVKQMNKTVVPGVELTVVSLKDKTKYPGKSNAAGEAVFYLPVGQDYEVDVAGVEAFHTFNLPNHAGVALEEVIFYEKTKVNETVKGDTIVQQSIAQTNGTSTHVLFTLNLKNFEGQPLADEPVFLQSSSGKRVYQGKTDAKGACSLMVEKGADYIVNLKYEQGLHLVEAPAGPGFRSASATRRYRGSKEIERVLAEQKAEMARIAEEERLAAIRQKEWEAGAAQRAKEYAERQAELEKIEAEQLAKREKELEARAAQVLSSVSYRTTPVEKAEMPANYLTKTAEGFNIDFGTSAGPMTTPTVVDNKLFTMAGVYSPNFYCLQAGTGQYLWGVELGESGISPAVYHNGVLLINTYSCSLYAIDATTGKLLWSHWLAGTVYSTPTASGNNVFVVYNHGGFYVVASFDLRTGTLHWIQRVDSETIACPVVDGNEVHVASQSGAYYVFQADNGKLLRESKKLKVVSSPTLTPETVFVTANINGQDKLVVLDRKTLEVKKTYATPLEAFEEREAHTHSTSPMNFNGSHPVVYQNKVVVLTDRNRIIAFDIATEKELWSKPLQSMADQVPVIADNKVYIGSADGQIMAYDLMTGAPTVIQKKGEIQGQPVAHNGFLYIASAGIVSVIKTVQKFGWGQWNRDASHNLYWK